MQMKSNLLRTVIPIACLTGVFAALPAGAEHGFVLVQVQDTQHRPVRGIEIGIEGFGGSKLSGDDGKAKLSIGNGAKENDWISLAILHSPPGADLVMISPWDNRSQIPSFEDKPDNFIRVVVVQRGDRAALESGSVLVSLAEKINKANAPKSDNDQAIQQETKANLDAVARQYGLAPEELDQAIRAWDTKTDDPYGAGLKALYERNYPKASDQLQDSLKQREERLAADRRTITLDREEVADASYFLGLSLFGQGKYRESTLSFGRCLQIRPDDPGVLLASALSMTEAGEYAAAEPLHRQALAIIEKAPGPYNHGVAIALRGLATLLEDKGEYSGAGPLYSQALAIDLGILPLSDPELSIDIGDIGGLLLKMGDYTAAEAMFRTALRIDKLALGPDHPYVATDLGNLGVLLEDEGDLARAEPFLRRALAINEKELGPDHPKVATDLNNLAVLLGNTGRHSEAEPLLRRALAINEKALGPDHPNVAGGLSNLAELLGKTDRYTEAESLFRQALTIDEKALGPEHPIVATIREDLALVLQAKSDYAGAEPLLRSALKIDEKALGPNHPDTGSDLNNLAYLLGLAGRFAEAEPLYRSALAINEKALGPDHPHTRQTRANLDALLEAEKEKGK
jgi:tetratricopeptide (TPR) repeat protein